MLQNEKDLLLYYLRFYIRVSVVKWKAVFRIRISLNADPDPGFYLSADPDSRSGFRIRDPDPRPFLPKN